MIRGMSGARVLLIVLASSAGLAVPPLSGGDAASDGAPGHWAYRPLTRRPPPEVSRGSWCRGTLDRIVLARLEEAGIEPSPGAGRRTLIRRLSLDLLGLPPEPDEVAAFVDDRAPDALARLVDRLLASPHFGERWGRHWLDGARYADSDGYEKDRPRPNAWRSRDWVIAAINADMPIDRFTIEQVAGDLLPDAGASQRLATAFNRQTLTNTEGGTDQEQFRVEAVFDRVATLGTVWLGLTASCAQCHDHKYDRLSQREFYRLFAFFDNGDEREIEVPASDLPGAPAMKVRVIEERTEKPRVTRIFRRGDFLSPEDEVTPGTPAVLPPIVPRGERADRLDLARWLVGAANPLTPRVLANEMWQHLFGEGIVTTANDFGVRGARPSSPELLDWLASELVRVEWSRKRMIRAIVTSATYGQSSRHREDLDEVDSTNRLLARQGRFRVEGELIRDLPLAVSGLLDRRIGGPSVFPPMPPGIAELSYANNFKWKTSEGADRYRRGLYTFFKRTAPYPGLMTFDCPDSNATTVERRVSNTPLQALTLLNNEVFVEAARAFAGRVLRESGPVDDERLRLAFLLALSRPPHGEESRALLGLLEESRRWYAAHPDDALAITGVSASGDDGQARAVELAAWTVTLRVILNTDEFVTRE